jgi:hypothetical protein
MMPSTKNSQEQAVATPKSAPLAEPPKPLLPHQVKKPLASFISEHNLPDLTNWLALEDEVTVRSVRKALHDKLVSFGEYIEHITYPEGLTDGWESGVFTESEQEELALFHKRIALLEKDCALLDLQSSPEEELGMTKRLASDWPTIVDEMKRVVNKTKEAYNGSQKLHGPASYLG